MPDAEALRDLYSDHTAEARAEEATLPREHHVVVRWNGRDWTTDGVDLAEIVNEDTPVPANDFPTFAAAQAAAKEMWWLHRAAGWGIRYGGTVVVEAQPDDEADPDAAHDARVDR